MKILRRLLVLFSFCFLLTVTNSSYASGIKNDPLYKDVKAVKLNFKVHSQNDLIFKRQDSELIRYLWERSSDEIEEKFRNVKVLQKSQNLPVNQANPYGALLINFEIHACCEVDRSHFVAIKISYARDVFAKDIEGTPKLHRLTDNSLDIKGAIISDGDKHLKEKLSDVINSHIVDNFNQIFEGK